MALNEHVCPICGENATVTGRSDPGFGKVVTCERCSKIIFELNVWDKFEEVDGWKFRACLYYYLAHNQKYNRKVYYIYDANLPNKIDENSNEIYNILTYQEIMNLFPKDYSETIDKILLNFMSLSDGIGSDISINIFDFISKNICFIDNIEKGLKIKSIINMLERIQWISIINRDLDGNFSFKIDHNGWLRIDQLLKDNKVFKKAFIAMCFDPNLKDVRDSIKSAITENKYEPVIIDEVEHNNEIMPEIFYAIQTSDFVVADLTHNRGGVYLEAGYALGLGKEVIFTVNETLQKQEDGKPNEAEIPHFDVQQRNQIRYKDAEDLKIKLKSRIEATIGLTKN